MKVIPLSAYLERSPGNSVAATASAMPMVTREEAIAEARREGEAQGRGAARHEYDAELQKERDGFATRLAEERKAWIAEQGQELANLINEGLAQIEEAIAQVIARLIEPLIVEDARKAALASLTKAVGEIMARPESAAIRIHGPDDLLAALRPSLGQRNNIVWSPGAGCDVQVETDNTVIQTRLEPWLAHLRETMG